MRRRDIIGSSLALTGSAALGSACFGKSIAADLRSLSAAEALAAIRGGQVSTLDYVDALLKQFDRHHNLNLTIAIDPQAVRTAAQAVDDARTRGEPLGPLAGLPLLVKDNIDTLGFATAAATPALRDNRPPGDAPVITRLRQQGALVLAKTNMHELASGGTSNNRAFGPVRNPYDPSRISGGSSGGTAAAIAVRCGPVGLGSDTAGSVRVPAAFCGIAGLRPSLWNRSRKRYPDGGLVPLALDLDTIGPMGRTVADVALLDAAIVGGAPVQARPLDGLRLGIPRGAPLCSPLAPDVAKVTEHALSRLAAGGVVLVEFDMRALYTEAEPLFWTLLAAGNHDDLATYLAGRPRPHSVAEVLRHVRSIDVRTRLGEAQKSKIDRNALVRARGDARSTLRHNYAALFARHRFDAIAFPTVPMVAPNVRENGDRPDDMIDFAGRSESQVMLLVRNTLHACAIGSPALSLPCGMTQVGLPVGLELEALPGDDDRLLSIGLAIEAVLPPLPPPILA